VERLRAAASVVPRPGWQLGIRHVTGYRYDGEVIASYNEVRLSPPTTERQVAHDVRVEVDPPARLTRYEDYWGTVVHAFDLQVTHRALVVTGQSLVETSGPPEPGPPVDWEALAPAAERWCEYLLPSPFVPADPELAELAAELARARGGPRVAVRRAVEAVQGRLLYERGYTTASTTAPEAWHRRRGVCQDFAHVTLGVLRAMGIPARYVSGYLHPAPDARPGDEVRGESHAWLEVWLGRWEALDPTGDEAVAERHVVVARGRDYGDVPPLKGVFTGASSPAPVVTVDLVRMG
jgi:transglutaminase-like putative cysteine protease